MDKQDYLYFLAKQALPAEEQFNFVEAHKQTASISVRNNLSKTNEAISNEPVPWCVGAYYLATRPVFALNPLWHAGAYYVQEASSMLLHQALRQLIPADEALRVLDLCAAPGGKSTLAIDALPKNSLLIANEVIKARASILAENVQRYGNINIWVTQNDPVDFKKVENYFDVILIDAPCSGSGLFRKDTKAHEEWSEANVALCAQRQERIIHDVQTALKPGGLLIYMTCSFSPEENEGIAEKIINELGFNYRALELKNEWGFSSTGLGYHAYPHKVRGEGFYLACFQKQNGETDFSLPYTKPRAKESKPAIPNEFINENEYYFTQGKELQLIAINKEHKEDLNFLLSKLHVIRKGVLCGSFMHKVFIPEHDLAMSTCCIFPNKIELDLQQALAYLRKENVEINVSNKGWYLCTYKGYALGWIKHLGNRINNYLPAHLRLRLNG
jgi:16S rRNA C967 or C1407 C5-methylase (RsmB/RsmF family)/NOL1/NOP2/fmu family ribosome biogenesis protein